MRTLIMKIFEATVVTLVTAAILSLLAGLWPTASRWLAPMFDAWWFPYVVVAGTAFSAGYFAAKWALAWVAAGPNSENDRLATEAVRVGKMCREASKGASGSDRHSANAAHAEASILRERLKEAGVEFPRPEPNLTQAEILESYSNIYSGIAPLLRGGYLDVAKDTATTLSFTYPGYLSEDRQRELGRDL